MNLMRRPNRVEQEKWVRYKYNLTTNIGEDGKRLTFSVDICISAPNGSWK